MKNATTNWREQLVKAAKADPKKAIILVMLVGVLVVMWGKLLGKGGPSGAAASQSQRAIAPSASPTSSAPRQAAREVANLDAMRAWAHRPVSPMSRNLFTINYEFFPQDGSKPAAPLRLPQGDGFWDQLAKSMTARADQKKEREVLVENLRLQAAQLKVQSTVMGASPRALVNGQLVGEGEVVASFRVLRIEARRIVVEREGIKLEVRFNQ